MPQSSDPNRRAFLSSLMATPFLAAACQKDYGRFFDIEWDEEVELHNGRIIIVHIKRTFERVTASMRRSRWKGMQESTEINFDAEGKIGKYQKKFDGYNISYINFDKGNWYIKLRGLDRVLNKSKEITTPSIPVWII